MKLIVTQPLFTEYCDILYFDEPKKQWKKFLANPSIKYTLGTLSQQKIILPNEIIEQIISALILIYLRNKQLDKFLDLIYSNSKFFLDVAFRMFFKVPKVPSDQQRHVLSKIVAIIFRADQQMDGHSTKECGSNIHYLETTFLVKKGCTPLPWNFHGVVQLQLLANVAFYSSVKSIVEVKTGPCIYDIVYVSGDHCEYDSCIDVTYLKTPVVIFSLKNWDTLKRIETKTSLSNDPCWNGFARLAKKFFGPHSAIFLRQQRNPPAPPLVFEIGK